MRSLVGSFGIAACGLITSVLVAILDVVAARTLDFDLFTLSVWAIVPVGAMLTGIAAASGYYFGSLYFHKRPSMFLLVQMVWIAGLTQLLIYWLGYTTALLGDGRKVADLIPFGQYLDFVLTKSHYRFGSSGIDMGESGTFGYARAGFQFIGFLFGGVVVFGYLLNQIVCPKCHLYLRPLAKTRKTFEDAEKAGAYYDGLFSLALDSPEFGERIRSQEKVKKVYRGTYMIDTKLMGCPGCKTQLVEEKVQVFNGKDWNEANNLTRQVSIPSGINLTPIFRK